MSVSMNFLSPADIFNAQYGGTAQQGLLDRMVNWIVDTITGSNRGEIVEAVNGMCSHDPAVSNVHCDNLMRLLGRENQHLFQHGVSDDGRFYTIFRPPIPCGGKMLIDRGTSSDKATHTIKQAFGEYMVDRLHDTLEKLYSPVESRRTKVLAYLTLYDEISKSHWHYFEDDGRTFVPKEESIYDLRMPSSPVENILSLCLPPDSPNRDKMEKCLNTLYDRFEPDSQKIKAFRELAEIKDSTIHENMTITSRAPYVMGTWELALNIKPLAEDFKMEWKKMDVNQAIMTSSINFGVLDEIEEALGNPEIATRQLCADINRDQYYLDETLINVNNHSGDNQDGMAAVNALLDDLTNLGATIQQLDSFLAVAHQKLYGMMIPSLSWPNSMMIPSTSSRGAVALYDIRWDENDNTINIRAVRRQDVCASQYGMEGMLSKGDIENHFEMMGQPINAIVKSTEVVVGLKIGVLGTISLTEEPLFLYNEGVPLDWTVEEQADNRFVSAYQGVELIPDEIKKTLEILEGSELP